MSETKPLYWVTTADNEEDARRRAPDNAVRDEHGQPAVRVWSKDDPSFQLAFRKMSAGPKLSDRAAWFFGQRKTFYRVDLEPDET